jgi:hypothetical protein
LNLKKTKAMKKILFLFATAAWLTSCGGGGATEADSTTEETAHDHGLHDHGHIEIDDLVPLEERLFVPEGAYVYFKNLKDGDRAKSPVRIEMGVEGMEVIPAGPIKKGTGHHHIIINGQFTPPGGVIPFDDTNIHFGQGQTEAALDLKPGTYLITMQFANGIHESYGEQMSSTIQIIVE